jgi:hypothetical protein
LSQVAFFFEEKVRIDFFYRPVHEPEIFLLFFRPAQGELRVHRNVPPRSIWIERWTRVMDWVWEITGGLRGQQRPTRIFCLTLSEYWKNGSWQDGCSKFHRRFGWRQWRGGERIFGVETKASNSRLANFRVILTGAVPGSPIFRTHGVLFYPCICVFLFLKG